MALRAEGAALDCFEVTLKCEEGEDDDEAVVVAVIPRPEPMLRVTQQEKTPLPRSSLLEAGDGCEEPKQQMSWEQEFLVGNSPGGSGRTLCMVCGAEIRSPSADTARAHILEEHPHTLDLSPSEKSNILEAWSEGVALLQDSNAEQPSPPVSATPATELGSKKPRGQRWKEPLGEEPVRKKRGRPMTKNLDPDPDPDPDPEPLSPDSPTETFAAPAEVRHFTDGSFPPGFVLQLFSHTQLKGADSKDLPQEGKAAAEGQAQTESPSPGSRRDLQAKLSVLAGLCSFLGGTRNRTQDLKLASSPFGAPRDTGSPGYPRADGGAPSGQPLARVVQAPPGHQGSGCR
ncbi:PREDICTED: uncharacterized protein C11orf84 homolog isoform X3 [Chinchilla lanigera]|uniref:uncharacterized protein C11orf84 homolog isoform X3 n=1 Tax=Chinchilla lanigera TaxID=34839 RepID=UPI0006982EFB|nr:PREDICTED: uncharacterized protein C11orf84 homolog isoform X3 [Chinchilla lanigera]